VWDDAGVCSLRVAKSAWAEIRSTFAGMPCELAGKYAV
jgi:hypothetical protein